MKWTYKRAEKEFQRRYYTRALRAGGLNVAQAAKLAQVNRTHFYNALKKLKLTRVQIRAAEVYSVRPYEKELRDFSRRFLKRALSRADFSPMKCAQLMGIDRTHVYRMAARLGVGLRGQRKISEGNSAWRALEDSAPSSPSPKPPTASASP